MPKIVDPVARRQEVVEAVFRIIAADGLERASLREVADEAGLAVGSVRHYFAGSEELLVYSFAAVVDRVTGRLVAAREAMSGLAPGSPEHYEAVLTLLGEFLPLDEERAVEACAWMAFKNAARIKRYLAGEADRSHRAVAAVVGQIVAELVVTELVDDDAGGHHMLVTEAERLLATLDGLCMHALLQPEWMTAQMCRDVLESHLAGMNARARSR
ncbi:TetR family transcriptional regulator C-terminal domain-containing protein [Micrococcaceae bacterium Sec5.7]